MTVIKQYNSVNSSWETVVVGAQGNQGNTGATGPQGSQGNQGPGVFSSQTTAPSSPSVGDRWYNTNTGRFYIYYYDGGSSQWVETGAPGPQGANGAQGNQGYQSSVAGPQGYQGYQGNQGNQSSIAGPQGYQGYQGYQGNQGNQSSIAGPQGDWSSAQTIRNESSVVSTTLSSTDAGKLVRFTGGAAINVTLKSGASGVTLTKGQRIDIVQTGTGTVITFLGGDHTLLSTPTAKLRDKNSAASIICLDDTSGAAIYILVGDLAAA